MNIQETVRGSDVFVIQSTCSPVNTHLMELLIMIDAFKRASAAQITAVMPYYGYARQDRKIKPGSHYSQAGCRLAYHCRRRQSTNHGFACGSNTGFFNIPVDNLFSMPLFAKDYLERGFSGEDTVVVSPDLGSVTRPEILPIS